MISDFWKNLCKIATIQKIIILVFAVYILTIFALISITPIYDSSPRMVFKQQEILERSEQFAHITEIFLPDQSSDFPFRFFQMIDTKQIQRHGAEQVTSSKSFTPVLFVPGHKGNFTQIIQLSGYLHNLLRNTEYDQPKLFYKFYSPDFRSAPSAFSMETLRR